MRQTMLMNNSTNNQPDVQEEPTATPQETPEQNADVVTVPKKRVWEVDFLRGFMILFVVWDHFMWDVGCVGSGVYNTGLFKWLYELQSAYYSGALRATTHDAFVTLFVFTSGVSCSFSRSNGKRALKMIVFAVLLSAITYAASSIVGQNVTIYFNVIHVIAFCVLLWAGFEWLSSKCTKDWQKNLFGFSVAAAIVAVLVVGYVAKNSPWTNENPMWFFLVQHAKTVVGYQKFMGGDYLPLFPDLGWFLVGGFLGKKLYASKQSLFPSVNEKWVSPVTFCGRYSIWIYLGSQTFMYSFVYLFHNVLNWL